LTGTLLIKFRVKVLHDLRLALFRHVLGLSTAYHSAHETGNLMSRQIDDVRNLNAVMADAAARLFTLALRAAAFLAMLFYIEWHLAAGSIVLIGGVYAIAYVTSPHLRALATDALEKWTELISAIHQGLSGHPLIQATAGETREARKFAGVLHKSIRADVKRDLFSLYYQQVNTAATTLGPALIVLAGVWLVVITDFTIGGLVAFFLYLGRLLVIVANLAGFNTRLQGSLASLSRIFEVLDEKPEVSTPGEGGRKLDVVGAIRLDGVSFAYESDRLVLRDINLDIAACSRIALVGHSGAGKSTLAALVPRFFDPVAGRILVDGVDLREVDLRSYRQQVGFVPQDVFLFDRTIGENIAIGKAKATAEEIRAAADAAYALEFIEELPEGLDTPIGERGVKLSGGQRQRLAIARELLRDPRILILDEATSAVDSESEALIQSALEHLLQGRTSIVIAHRLSTVIGSDLILVMEQGRIVERGCHDELLALDDRYADLYHRQFESPGTWR
jgi:ABC-type multidrug transport system fused ATPase/permease subunit